MNRRQKLVQKQFLNSEEKVIEQLDDIYGQSLKDVTTKIEKLEFKIGKLQEEYDWLDDKDPRKAQIKSKIQSKIYQKQYQQQLQKQLDGILGQLRTNAYVTVSDYLDGCYNDGFIGTIFDLHGQGIPIVAPIDQESMVRAVQLDSKISKGLYTRLGEDVNLLKRKITAQVSRGISTGMSFQQVALQIAGDTRVGYNNAIRIARTEGHRIQCQAAMDACHNAKDKGANVLKQWDATLDGRTRDSHARIHGEVRELDKPFSNGLMFPGDPDGSAAEVINCRCALLQRAKWALDETELVKLKEDAVFFGLDKSDQFDDFKKKFLKATVGDGIDANLKLDTIEPTAHYRTFDSGDEANEALKHATDKWEESITSIQSTAIHHYTGIGYYDVNTYLRKLPGYEYCNSDLIGDLVEDIDSAIKKFTLDENIKVFRGCGIDTFGISDFDQLPIGSIFVDNGYMSTSVVRDGIRESDVLLEIFVPRGKNIGAYINPVSRFADEEYEFLLRRGTKCKILEVDTSGEMPIIKMEVMK